MKIRRLLPKAKATGSNLAPVRPFDLERLKKPAWFDARMSVVRRKERFKTAPLSDFGVSVPGYFEHPERFEEGFRHGMGSNGLIEIRMFRPSFREGFRMAKLWWRKFYPQHRLACSGSWKSVIKSQW